MNFFNFTDTTSNPNIQKALTELNQHLDLFDLNHYQDITDNINSSSTLPMTLINFNLPLETILDKNDPEHQQDPEAHHLENALLENSHNFDQILSQIITITQNLKATLDSISIYIINDTSGTYLEIKIYCYPIDEIQLNNYFNQPKIIKEDPLLRRINTLQSKFKQNHDLKNLTQLLLHLKEMQTKLVPNQEFNIYWPTMNNYPMT